MLTTVDTICRSPSSILARYRIRSPKSKPRAGGLSAYSESHRGPDTVISVGTDVEFESVGTVKHRLLRIPTGSHRGGNERSGCLAGPKRRPGTCYTKRELSTVPDIESGCTSVHSAVPTGNIRRVPPLNSSHTVYQPLVVACTTFRPTCTICNSSCTMQADVLSQTCPYLARFLGQVFSHYSCHTHTHRYDIIDPPHLR